MSEIVWQDPPATKTERVDWRAIVDALKADPGRWALVAEGKHSSGYTSLRSHGCEARSVSRRDGKFDIYARWPVAS